MIWDRTAAAVGQVYHFAHDMSKDETAVMYDPTSRHYRIGTVTGDCIATPDVDGIEYARIMFKGPDGGRDVIM